MGDGAVTSSATMMEAPPDGGVSMDFDYMSELLLDGCWLEASADGSDLLLQSSPFSNPLFDPSFSWPALEPPHNEDQQQDANPLGCTQQESQNIVSVAGNSSNNQQYQSETHSGTSEVVRRWWIAPTPYPGPAGSSIMEKLIRALKLIRDFNRNKDMLIQIWVPDNRGDGPILRANDLLFSLETGSSNLAKYREVSVRYRFSAEEDSKELVPGLPGRVYRDKVPEWTPDVRFFRSDEYPRVGDAQECDIRGTLAVPIFEQGSRTCLGVIEVVKTTQQINYGPELESVCKALEVFSPPCLFAYHLQNTEECMNPKKNLNQRTSGFRTVKFLCCFQHFICYF